MVSTFPRSAMSLSSMRATRAPDSEKSTSAARHSRVKSSTRVRIRKRRPFAKASVMKSIDQRSFGRLGGGGTLRSEAATRFRFCLRTTRFLRVGIRPPLLAVQAIDPLVVYPVASPTKQSMEPSVPEPRTLGRNLAKFLEEVHRFLSPRFVPVRRPTEADHSAGAPLGTSECSEKIAHSLAPSGGLYHFFGRPP